MDMVKKAYQIQEAELSRIMQIPQFNPVYRFLRDHPLTIPEELFGKANQYLIQNSYYEHAKKLMLRVPFPRDRSALKPYQNRLQMIANECMARARPLQREALTQAFEMHLDKIKKKIIPFRKNGHDEAANAIEALYKKIKQSYDHTLPINGVKFKQDYERAIADARSELESHRGYKLALGYTMCVLTVLGILIVLIDLGHLYATGKHLSFFQTDSAQHLVALEDALDELTEYFEVPEDFSRYEASL
jgi:hypothetical protein